MPSVLVPTARWQRWVANFATGHGGADLSVADGALARTGGRRLPLHGPAALRDVRTTARPRPAPSRPRPGPPGQWGVLLVRKGGFAVARMGGAALVEHKIGQRHVQGRTKAGGQSQQRFARRRDNQARQAYEAAADHAARILGGVRLVVAGGDHAAVDAVLTDQRLSSVTVVDPWLAVPDPRAGRC